MTDTTTPPAIQELKTRAEILQHRIETRDPAAIARLRKLPQFRRINDEQLTEAAAAIRRADCLTVIAAETGFANWPHALRIISGEANDDFGTLLCPERAALHLNRWYRTYEEARQDMDASELRTYLLAYRKQFLIVDPFYILEALGVDPEDPDWTAIGFDWAKPPDVAARTRLYGKIIGSHETR